MKLLHVYGIAIFLLVSVVEQDGLRITWSDTPKSGFLASQSKLCDIVQAVKALVILCVRAFGAPVCNK